MKTAPVTALSVSPPKKNTIYPQPFNDVVSGRTKRKLGDVFALSNFGVNLTQLEPGAASALLHRHATQDEFIYVLEGTPTLILHQQEYLMQPGDCVGFKAGAPAAHQLVNRSGGPVTFIEVGDRSPGDICEYPDDDLRAELATDDSWTFSHKDGRPY
jgi:uncharacterized cupin superfamily protein